MTGDNSKLEKAIDDMAANSDKINLTKVLNELRALMCGDGHILVPVELPQAAKDMINMEKTVSGNGVKAPENMHYIPLRLKLGDGRTCFPAFTSENELSKGEVTSSVTQSVDEFIRAVSDVEDVQGALINPWGRPFLLTKEMIAILLNSFGEQESHIFFDIGDITQIDCECIVNAANESLLGGGGVDGAIHRAAGPGLLEECRTLHGCRTGQAKITGGYRLKAEYIIHTVGPVYSGNKNDAQLLSDCYWNCLELAKRHYIHSIAFPAISTGVYGYPAEQAAVVALNTIVKWLEENKDYRIAVILSCFDRKTYDIYQSYIDYCRSSAETEND